MASKKASTGGPKVNLTDEQLAAECRKLALAGHTTKGAMLRELRGTKKGTRQQRLFPIADKVLAQLRKEGKVPKATAAKGAPKGTARKGGTRKASTTKKATRAQRKAA